MLNWNDFLISLSTSMYLRAATHPAAQPARRSAAHPARGGGGRAGARGPVNLLLGEGGLQDFEVVDEVHLDLRVLLHLRHGHGARVNGIDDLAIDNTRRKVLDLVEPRVEVAPDPLAQLLAANEVAFVHHAHRAHGVCVCAEVLKLASASPAVRLNYYQLEVNLT